MNKTIVLWGRMSNNKILIVCNNIDNGNKMLEKLLGEFKFKDFEYFTKGYGASRAKLKNGNLYIVIKESPNIIGHRFNALYIDETVSKSFIDDCLKPHFINGEENIFYFNE